VNLGGAFYNGFILPESRTSLLYGWRDGRALPSLHP